MWVRKRIDIEFADIAWALAQGASARGLSRSCEPSVASFLGDKRFLLTLSLRSGFDAFLSVVDWPTESEIVLTGVTIPDMHRIIRHHGYQLVPVPIDAASLAPSLDHLSAAITPRTRAIMVTHLMGGRINQDAISRLCRLHGLMLIDDAAQSFAGNVLAIDSQADLVLQSFGPIKTCTSLGGGVVWARDQSLAEAIGDQMKGWPRQSSRQYRQRLIKYAAVRSLCHRISARIASQSFRMAGTNHDTWASGLTRNFHADEASFFARIRGRPCALMWSLLKRRLSRYPHQQIVDRRQAGERLRQLLPKSIVVFGETMPQQTYWLFAIKSRAPDVLVHHLWKHHFDATRRMSLADFSQSPVLDNTVLLPVDPRMPDAELVRLSGLVQQIECDESRAPIRECGAVDHA